MTRWMMLQIVLLITVLVLVNCMKEAGEDGLCYKVEALGQREGNTYYCEDPELPTCCQQDDQHKCCEDEDGKVMNDQIMLWGVVCLFVIGTGIVVILLKAQGDVWEKETLRKSLCNLASKLGMKKVAYKVRTMRKKGQAKEEEVSTKEELNNMPLAWF